MRKPRDQEWLNGQCIMMEGLFNTLGNDIIGMSTIVPLFLTYLGASLSVIGAMTTVQQIFGAIVPLLCGGIVAAAKSKRSFSMLLNGISRGAFLLIPLGILLGLSNEAMLVLFLCIIAVYALCQPITGLTWNYLLGDCVPNERRGKLLGTLYALSGIITFLSSTIIKGIRANPALSELNQYAAIFALGGFLMACSVLFYIPLREKTQGSGAKEERSFRHYLAQLRSCYDNRLFRKVIATNICSQIALSINAFFYIYAQNVLGLTANQISNLIVVQTLGLMLGGFVTGRISDRFGLKRMLQTIETLGLLVPALGLAAGKLEAPFWAAATAVFVIGFTKSGLIGYQAYILEIVPSEQSVYHNVAKSLALLPFSFANVVMGVVITRFSNNVAFVVQIVFACLALLGASSLRLNVYKKKKA